MSIGIEGDRATVSLNRPEVHNAFNPAVIAELTAAFADLANHPTIRVIVLSGEGRSFCAGADANWMRASLGLSEAENVADAIRMSDMFATIDECPVPVIGRIHGAALGGGMGLAAVCDIGIAADDTVFGFTETRLGILPAVISRFVVPKIGSSWARRYFLSGERFGSDEARLMGLVHTVAPISQLDARVDAQVAALVEAGPAAGREAKALIRGLRNLPVSGWREYTAGRIASIRTSPEGQEGLRAFLEKRPPAWRV